MTADNNSENLRQRTRTTDDEEDEDTTIPEDVLRVKEKLEAKTGKKYKYRPAKKDLPSVGELLKQGNSKPLSFKESIGYAVGLAALFAISLFLFHHLVLTRPPKQSYNINRGRM